MKPQRAKHLHVFFVVFGGQLYALLLGVGQEEMEDMVLIKSMGTQANSTYREKLSHLEKRFEDLTLKAPDIFEKNALDPVNFCQAFNDSLGIIFDLHAKKILFKFFHAS